MIASAANWSMSLTDTVVCYLVIFTETCHQQSSNARIWSTPIMQFLLHAYLLTVFARMYTRIPLMAKHNDWHEWSVDTSSTSSSAHMPLFVLCLVAQVVLPVNYAKVWQHLLLIPHKWATFLLVRTCRYVLRFIVAVGQSCSHQGARLYGCEFFNHPNLIC